MQHLGKQVSQRFWKSRKLRSLQERLSRKLNAGQKKIHCSTERIDLRTETGRFMLSSGPSGNGLLRRRYLPIHFYFVSLEFACYTGGRSLARRRAFRACLEPGQTEVRHLHQWPAAFGSLSRDNDDVLGLNRRIRKLVKTGRRKHTHDLFCHAQRGVSRHWTVLGNPRCKRFAW